MTTYTLGPYPVSPVPGTAGGLLDIGDPFPLPETLPGSGLYEMDFVFVDFDGLIALGVVAEDIVGGPRFRFTRRARPHIQVGLGSTVAFSSALWDSALWDDVAALWSGVEPTWRDVECNVIEVHTETGRERISDPFVPGVAEVLVDNTSGWADPTIADDAPGVLSMRPGRAIRIMVEHSILGTSVLWRGYIDSIEPVYSPVDTDTVMLRCIDALAEAGRSKLAETVESGANEFAHTRVGRILGKLRWATELQALDVTSTEMFAGVLEGQTMDLLTRTADSCGGWIFGDQLGRITLRNRDWLFYSGIPDATIGNFIARPFDEPVESEPGLWQWNPSYMSETSSGSGLFTYVGPVVDWSEPAPGLFEPFEIVEDDVCPVAFSRAFDRQAIATQVVIDRIAPEDSPELQPLTFNDPNAQVLYGVETFEKTDLWTRDNDEAARIGIRTLETRSAQASMPRLASVELDAATSDAALDVQTVVSPFTPSRYRCRFQRPGDANPVFDDVFFAAGVVHDMTPDSWVTRISLDRATFYELNEPGPYLWDVALWSNALWN